MDFAWNVNLLLYLTTKILMNSSLKMDFAKIITMITLILSMTMFLMLSNYSNKNILGMNLNNLIFILEMSIRTLLIIITTIIMDLIQKKIKLSLIHRNKKISYLLLNPRMRKNMSSFF